MLSFVSFSRAVLADAGVPGVPMEHMNAVPCLVFGPIVALTFGVVVRALAAQRFPWAVRVDARLRQLTAIDKAALVIVLMAGAVKCAVAPTHWAANKPWHYLITHLAYERTMAYAFVLDAIGFFVAAIVLFVNRSWGRFLAAASCIATIIGYTAYMVYGWESADPVGLTITLLELTAALLLLVQAYRNGDVASGASGGSVSVAAAVSSWETEPWYDTRTDQRSADRWVGAGVPEPVWDQATGAPWAAPAPQGSDAWQPAAEAIYGSQAASPPSGWPPAQNWGTAAPPSQAAPPQAPGAAGWPTQGWRPARP